MIVKGFGTNARSQAPCVSRSCKEYKKLVRKGAQDQGHLSHFEFV